MYQEVIGNIKQKLEAADLYPLKKQAELSSRILEERLEQILPWAMKESDVDAWIILSREYGEDPIIKTFFTWDMPTAGRVSALLFHRDAESGKIRKLLFGMCSSEMANFYENAQKKGENIWEAIGRVVSELNPEKIAVNKSAIFGCCDGLTASLSEKLKAALGETFAERICDGEVLAVRWLQRVTPLEKEAMKVLTSVTHDIVNYTFSRAFIIPNKTTTTDIEWKMREMIQDIGYDYWFGPDVDLQRRGGSSPRMFEETIQCGDLIHCDIGLNGRYVHLHTDMQWVAYILSEGENGVPEEIQKLLDKGNRFRHIVMEEMKVGVSGNDIFFRAMERGKAEGIQPMLYTHPLGTFGHGAGAMIGLYSTQDFVPGNGEFLMEDKTCYALELNVFDNLFQ